MNGKIPCVKVRRRVAERTRRKLAKLGILDLEHRPKVSRGYVYFPVRRKPRGFTIVMKRLERVSKKPKSIFEALKKKGISIEGLLRSFEIIGDTAIIEIPNEISKHEKEIAKAIMEVHQNVKTVCRKVGPVSGKYRIKKLKVILGRKKTEIV